MRKTINREQDHDDKVMGLEIFEYICQDIYLFFV